MRCSVDTLSGPGSEPRASAVFGDVTEPPEMSDSTLPDPLDNPDLCLVSVEP